MQMAIAVHESTSIHAIKEWAMTVTRPDFLHQPRRVEIAANDCAVAFGDLLYLIKDL
jgi:hypothetical protein